MNVQEKLTPLMQQYVTIKQQYADALVLFQVGDFYELFFDDAKQAAAFLGIALTKRGTNNGEPIPLCGVPVHALDHYLAKLVRAGFKVAICDQLEEAVPGRMVERGITRVLTPGTLTDSKLLDAKSASYLFSFFPTGEQWGLLFGELLTAQLYATTLPIEAHKLLEAEVTRFFPDEILVPEQSKEFQTYFKRLGYFTTTVPLLPDDAHDAGAARGWVSRQFKRENVTALYNNNGLRGALYSFHDYLKKNQESALDHFHTIHFYQPEDFLMLDPATQKNLELVKSMHDGTSANTLLELLDGAVTAMGSRTIKKWILRPLVRQELIEQRHDALDAFKHDLAFMQAVEKLLKEVGDLERVVGRIALRRAQFHDYVMLMQTLGIVPELKKLMGAKSDISLLRLIEQRIPNLEAMHTTLLCALNDDTAKDWLIKSSFNERLDRLRDLVDNSQTKILALETQEQQRTGIQSLKIRYNSVSGYYIEVTKANLDSVPDYYQRQQTLVGRERFMTPELRSLQGEIVTARQEVLSVEKELFESLKRDVVEHLFPLRHLAQAIAQCDALLGLAKVAYNEGYVRPTFNAHREIIIDQGKHPVVAQRLRNQFIPNNTNLIDAESLLIITGPNMGGKSTYLRQVALTCIMAQCGSFVPAQEASLPLLDRVFTRIGAGDNVAAGKSTFLVEMEETALICTHATRNSLVILDEVGRGTSTFDGLALAQAVVEYVYTNVQARCLFATHYHELTTLEHQYPGIVSYHAASKKTDQGIIFLYKMMRGTADGSFGLEVAKLAGIPQSIVDRAQEILEQLEHNGKLPEYSSDEKMVTALRMLQSELATKNKILTQLDSIDYDTMSPRQAFDLLWSLRQGRVSTPDSSSQNNIPEN